MNILLPLAAYLLFIVCYWGFALAIVWHVRHHRLPGDRSPVYITAYYSIAITLSILSLLLFFSLPLTY